LLYKGQNGHKNTTNYPPSWTFGGETIFFTFTLLSTIGYGYLAPSTEEGKIFCVFYILLGIPLNFLVLYSLADRFEYLVTHRKYPHVLKRVTNETHVMYYKERQRQNYKYYMKCVVTGFCLLLFIYVIPSIAFSYVMEYPSWSFLDALYFCYISISTVGFGNYT
jgi:hypothetical protein